jgi:ADP-heptose:LPS heptosyltransferase
LKLFVSNSTGPLHLAVALDVPTVSFFGLTPATRPARWGPYAPGHVVLTPPDTGETLSRLDLIPLDTAFDACTRQLARHAS